MHTLHRHRLVLDWCACSPDLSKGSKGKQNGKPCILAPLKLVEKNRQNNK